MPPVTSNMSPSNPSGNKGNNMNNSAGHGNQRPGNFSNSSSVNKTNSGGYNGNNNALSGGPCVKVFIKNVSLFYHFGLKKNCIVTN
jgi:hypothetical protein